MATESARVVLNGRFPAGERVTLIEVAGAHVMRSEGGREIGSAVIGDDQHVEFVAHVVRGGYYFIVGRVNGQLREVRARGKADGDNETLTQAPVVQQPTFPAVGHQAPVPPVTVEPGQAGDAVDGDAPTKTELLARAKELGIKGRSQMSADALAASIAEAESKLDQTSA